MDVTVCVATFGDASWGELAAARAIPSAGRLGVPVVHVHDKTLHDARNTAVSLTRSEWVIHLDADDELEEGYIDAMAAGHGDVRASAVRYVNPGGRAAEPYVPRVAGHQGTHSAECAGDCLRDGNWIVVGAAVRRQLVLDVGGWRDFTWSEDWDLWLRCYLAGAEIWACPQAIYRAHVRRDSRNRAPSRAAKLAAHQAIAAANGIGAPS